jgi:putative hemolysin/phosphoserine phosphatase
VKHLTTTLITLSLAILLLGACVPAPAAPASPVASPTAADWQTYTNAEVGFSIEMPSTWSQQTLPDQNAGAIHGQAFTGPEGGVEVYWGVGFGGACPGGTEPVQLAQGELPACHATNSDGTETWSQIGYQVSGGNSFSVRAYTSDGQPSSHDLVLQVLSTLAFMPPAQPQAEAAVANPASENCIKQGGTLSIVERGDGGQYGICLFEDNLQCEEWAMMRGDCPVGGLKVTGYITPAAQYCAITGGTYAITGNSGQDDEQGTCTFKNGSQCDAWDYYNGKCDQSAATADPLPSWNPGPAKDTILKFVADVTDPASPSYVPPAERIAVLDNDGTLWTEKPVPVQAAFVFARIQQMAKDHPEWSTTQPYAAVLSGDQAAIQQFTPADIEELVYATHAGMTEEEFESIAKAFLDTAVHPRFKVPYTQTVYQPLLELLDLLRANDFQPYIVSGGGADFMRVFAADVYGIPPDDVVGSSLQYEFQQTSSITGDLIRKPEMVTIDDKEMKPVNIQRHIGRRPIMAVGNSDGDLPMFQYTAGGKLPYLNLLIVHDDAEREYDYLSGTDAMMTAAAQSPWMFVSMRQNFKTVFPPTP